MRSNGPVMLNGSLVYGYFQASAGGTRLRLSVDEFDRLNLCEGQRVRATWPNSEPAEWLLLGVERTPPFVWLELRALAKPAPLSARAG